MPAVGVVTDPLLSLPKATFHPLLNYIGDSHCFSFILCSFFHRRNFSAVGSSTLTLTLARTVYSLQKPLPSIHLGSSNLMKSCKFKYRLNFFMALISPALPSQIKLSVNSRDSYHNFVSHHNGWHWLLRFPKQDKTSQTLVIPIKKLVLSCRSQNRCASTYSSYS